MAASIRQVTLALLKPDLCADPLRVRAVVNILESADSGLEILHRRRLLWSEEEAGHFYAEHKGRFFYERLVGYMTSRAFEALALEGPNAIQQWRSLIGPTQPVRARISMPMTLRAMYGLTDTRNSFHGSDSPETARAELALFFPKFYPGA
ncbi:nucleoside diphosphate kinase [Piptocephalis cylindrospora]|uniref:Nucleoside diphosphate kinase n=1 Tax=Piptocephalis cylindrospora TaxID=1907219 RepID=A0A4P9Y3H3_9FUNG|nr:nucleoside diphosphate kinase [Piptocephalis cylindrospora]|eukprot:RKP13466.1 nucleoside diphosphate kinase [Piptocephalis cylindrospora]